MDIALIGVTIAVVAVFGVAAFAQIKAVYHFIRWWSGVTPGQRWGLSFLGPFALLWNRRLPEEALRHRALFIKWEAVFLLMFAVIAIGDFLMKHQPNHFVPANPASVEKKS